MDCNGCLWRNPETCRNCKNELETHTIYQGKAKDMTPEKITLGSIGKVWRLDETDKELISKN
jgi:hypothetical protein